MTPILSPARKETSGMPMHATGDQSLWDIHDLPAPTRTMDFHELPTDTPMVLQNQQRLAKVGNEIVRVNNHPEDHIPGIMERFEALALQQQKESGATVDPKDSPRTEILKKGALLLGGAPEPRNPLTITRLGSTLCRPPAIQEDM
jgi:hypothetical protein